MFLTFLQFKTRHFTKHGGLFKTAFAWFSECYFFVEGELCEDDLQTSPESEQPNNKL